MSDWRQTQTEKYKEAVKARNGETRQTFEAEAYCRVVTACVVLLHGGDPLSVFVCKRILSSAWYDHAHGHMQPLSHSLHYATEVAFQ